MVHEDQYIERAKSGDEEAFSELMNHYETRVYRFLLRMTRSTEDALDLSQETFLRVYRSLSLFKNQSAFSTWIFSIAHHLCVDHARKQARKKRFTFHSVDEEDALALPDTNPTPDAVAENKLLASEIDRALSEITPDLREIFLLREVSGLSYAEIAETLELELGTVKSRIARARVALQKELSDLRNKSVKNPSNDMEGR